MPLKVVLVEDDLLYRDLLRIGLTQSRRVEIAGMFQDAESALARVPTLNADVALLDIVLRNSFNGIQLGRLLRCHMPQLGVVLLSNHRIPAYLSAIPRENLGGWSYLLKSSVENVDALVRAVEGSAAGHVVVDEALFPAMPPRGTGRLQALTPRQLEILRLMALGFTNQAIADQMALSRKTVENQINHLFQELQVDPADTTVQARVQAVLIYLQESGLL
ncbi:MAG: response regulator transcription factor [Bacillota bacterium]